MKSLFKNLSAIAPLSQSKTFQKRYFTSIFFTLLTTLPSTTLFFLLPSQKILAQSVACQSPYNEVYSGQSGSTIVSVHAPSGATIPLTTTGLAGTVNSLATDHVNHLVYYAEGTKVFAWDAINNQHITITSDIRTFNPAVSQNAIVLSNGGAAYYNGSLYLGVDPPSAGVFEIYKVDFVPGSNGKQIQKVTPLNINGVGKANGKLNDGDWGDFIISNQGVIYGSSGGTAKYWSYDLNTSSFTDLVDNIPQSSQLAKDGSGRLWAFRNGTNSVMEIQIVGNTIQTVGNASSTGSHSSADGAECVTGEASVGDRVWSDTNGNGIQDAGETGIAGVTVAIYRDIDKDGVIDTNEPKLATQVTDANGNYNFTSLLPHDRGTGAGKNDFIVKVESGVPAAYTATTPIQKNADLSSATQTIDTLDFGYKPPTYNISGTLYEDSDRSDDLNATEPKLPANITVNLLDSSNNVLKTTTTDANGAYTFTGVTNGSYKIQADTTDTDISPDLTLGTPNDLAVTVTNTNITGQNFGFDRNIVPPPPATYCKSPYGEVYATVTPNKLFAVHGATGASIELTTTGNTSAINGMATDHANKLVFYGDGNSLYAWDAISGQHITITSNFSSFLPSSYTSQNTFTTLSSGGAAFYNGSLYVGVDGNPNTNPHFEIFKVDFAPGSNGKTIQKVTPLNIIANSGGGMIRTDEDWGDFTISDTGVILGITTRNASTRIAHLWNYDLNTNTFTNIGVPSGNHQLAKSGDGKLWALFSSGNVQELLPNGTYVGPIKPTIVVSDAGECVVGEASVGDRVWSDTNGDGVQDTGETGIAGVTVAIYRDINKNGVIDATDPKLATQVTDANGNYNFTDLLPHDRATGANHNDFIVKVESGVPTGYTATTPTQKNADLSSATQTIDTLDFGYRIPSNPNVLLVKRITAVNNLTTTKNGDNLAGYIDEITNLYDDNTLDNPVSPAKPDTKNWLDPSTFLIGGINGGNVQPNDEIEYTIYYLSAGDTTASNVLICDRVPENATFIPTAFNSFPTKNITGLPGADRGIIWQYNGATESLTNSNDGDKAEYLSPGVDPTIKYPGIKCDGSNTNGVVVVNLKDLPNAIAPGTPVNSYGFVRFRGRVK
ncbi:SdrD B-like domain-containing protein [Brunnivagina elsteri]|uniref:SD-repeat containing protein B domain-containing protein n=1 Tax=Brunnivagina elsteri CCALA 953 TaxID=987040 RepID=A0A2A2TKX4_9CYAN|nr:SdrD B-like domain-containing protein [Calothrix elsteri]PAX57108.1 hypothetical protein CK510_09545 [Calothrix elsteri CCALA 953]